MPIYTPNGLKIRLEPEHAFTYMGRLREKYRPAEVLRMVEGIEVIETLILLISISVCFSLPLTYTQLAIAVFILSILFNTIGAALALHIGPKLLLLASKYVNESALYLVFIIYGYFTVGGLGIFYAFAALVVGFISNFLLQLAQTRKAFKIAGTHLTKSERSFFRAFSLCANKIGASTELNIKDEEKQNSGWYTDYTLYEMNLKSKK